jgi:hypothetical protein
MKRKYLEPALLGLILLGIVVLAAYPYLRRSRVSSDVTSTATNDRQYSTNMNELRERFNQDKGKVRLLLLLSPT